jgi:hypothetical protein
VHECGVEEHGVALAQGHLHHAGGEEVDELLAVERDVTARELLRVGQQHRRPALQRHVAVRDGALQGQGGRHAVHVRGVGRELIGVDEPEVVVAVRNLRGATGIDDVDL